MSARALSPISAFPQSLTLSYSPKSNPNLNECSSLSYFPKSSPNPNECRNERRERAHVHAHTQVAELPKKSGQLILNLTTPKTKCISSESTVYWYRYLSRVQVYDQVGYDISSKSSAFRLTLGCSMGPTIVESMVTGSH